ncbi:MAG: ABC transporter substrate-binding protein [Betaproteobacteria bacterium]|nr:ABC transporter substrate-binding protein [Betaproteobacteria bacterium]
MPRRLFGLMAFAGVVFLCAASAQAQIKLGVSGPLEGKNAGSMLEVLKGAELYIGQVNANGGVNGQKVKLIARDDNFEVPKTVATVTRLIEQDNVVGLMLVRGTPHNQAILPLIEKHQVPLIGPSTGAMTFHQPVNRYVFNVRTAYQLEAEKLVALLKTTGLHRIAVLSVADGFGRDVLKGLDSGLAKQNLKPAIELEFDRDAATKDNTDFMKPVLDKLVKSDPQVIIVVGAGLAVKNAIVALRAAGSEARIATVSNNASTAFIKLLDKHAHGVIVSQVFPDEKSLTQPFVREAQMAAFKNKVTLTQGMLEGFAAAKIAVRGLKGAGTPVTRAGLQKALDNLGTFDLGDLAINYSPNDHTGLDMTDLSIITRDKTFLR